MNENIFLNFGNIDILKLFINIDRAVRILILKKSLAG